jgi:hypothetical protein
MGKSMSNLEGGTKQTHESRKKTYVSDFIAGMNAGNVPENPFSCKSRTLGVQKNASRLNTIVSEFKLNCNEILVVVHHILEVHSHTTLQQYFVTTT